MKKLMTVLLGLSFLGAPARFAQVPAATPDTKTAPAKKAPKTKAAKKTVEKKETTEKTAKKGKSTTEKTVTKKAKKAPTKKPIPPSQLYVPGKPRSGTLLRGNPVQASLCFSPQRSCRFSPVRLPLSRTKFAAVGYLSRPTWFNGQSA